MKKEIRHIDKERGIVQITTADERWYVKPTPDTITGNPSHEFIPSVTWIAGYYPKGIHFYKWLAEKGWDEAEAMKQSAGDKGSKVHSACQDIDVGIKIPLNARYINPTTSVEEELTVDEVDCILSFCNWLDEEKPQLIASELTVFGDGYAGTIDRIYRINNTVWVVDLKTSQYIWEEHKLQLSAYSHAEIELSVLGITTEEWTARKLGVLQLGYKKNGKGFKFTEIEDKFDMFKNVAMAIWKNENPNTKPKQKDYPLLLLSNERTKRGGK